LEASARLGKLDPVLHRSLDVLFEFLGKFLLALVLIPAIVGASVFVLDRSQAVTARVWTERPFFMVDIDPLAQAPLVKPSVIEAALMTELVSTDSFLSKVLASAQPSFSTERVADQVAAVRDLRSRLTIVSEGDHVLTLTYRAPHPSQGVVLLGALIRSFEDTVTQLEFRQESLQGGATIAQIAAARTALEESYAAVQAYRATLTDIRPEALAQNPSFQTLAQEANTRLNQYLALLAVQQQSDLAKTAIPQLQSAVFQIVDPPAVTPTPFSLKAPAVRLFQLALALTAATELFVIYLMARRDPRVRTGREVEKRVAIRYLGSTPTLERPAA
jgi:uncharacterized protein involved in exopolysaccharide biosynthesis